MAAVVTFEVAETSYQMLKGLSFCDRERSLKVTVLTFLVKNGKMKLSRVFIF